jgi:hypothetical protein
LVAIRHDRLEPSTISGANFVLGRVKAISLRRTRARILSVSRGLRRFAIPFSVGGFPRDPAARAGAECRRSFCLATLLAGRSPPLIDPGGSTPNNIRSCLSVRSGAGWLEGRPFFHPHQRVCSVAKEGRHSRSQAISIFSLWRLNSHLLPRPSVSTSGPARRLRRCGPRVSYQTRDLPDRRQLIAAQRSAWCNSSL